MKNLITNLAMSVLVLGLFVGCTESSSGNKSAGSPTVPEPVPGPKELQDCKEFVGTLLSENGRGLDSLLETSVLEFTGTSAFDVGVCVDSRINFECTFEKCEINERTVQ